MNAKALAQVLTSQDDCTDKNGVIEIGEETSVTLYASIGSESLIVGSVASVEFMDDLVLARTRKGDTFAIVSQDVRALRFGPGSGSRRTGLIK